MGDVSVVPAHLTDWRLRLSAVDAVPPLVIITFAAWLQDTLTTVSAVCTRRLPG